jgi:hypothetical protein
MWGLLEESLVNLIGRKESAGVNITGNALKVKL